MAVNSIITTHCKVSDPDTPPLFYKLAESCQTAEGTLSFYQSTESDDVSWDEFLMQTPLGQFQQSSMWAQVKEVDGWESLRIVATLRDQIVGGFQILSRDTRFGRIGNVSKGPVAAPETEDLVELLVVAMRRQANESKIIGLIVQPPDESKITSKILDRHHFIQSNPMGVIETTLLVDVGNGKEALDKGMTRKTRKYARLANQSGVTIREGKEDDVALFFDLMNATCKRQGEKPSPSSVEALRQLWRVFSKRNCFRATFAEYNNEVIAGSLNIPFGKKVNLWKKGWNYKYPEQHPNHLLYYEILHWACSNKFDHCDFIAFQRSIADALQKGIPLSEAQEKSRHIFNLRFGGVPKILPPARLWIANPLLRFGYENVFVHLSTFIHQLNPGLLGTRSS
jgi:lipid II:glycine glycyltransferase (peptidoglycan interpeptide bridge formation enzyme)